MRISGEPTDEEAAAIVAAIELLTPQAVAQAAPTRPSPSWRFSGRGWYRRPGWPASSI